MSHDKYCIRYIRTKNKIRKIITYDNDLSKQKHFFIANKINNNFNPSIFTKGYVKGESIYTNARAHMYNDYFIKVDIKDFFISINHRLLRKKIYKELSLIASPADCDKIVKECSYYDKGLPLGFVTSPLLSNIYLKDFDFLLYKYLKKLECKNIIYTRYADDIIVSFKMGKKNPEFIFRKSVKYIENLLNEFHLKLNLNKTKFINFNKSKQVRITGVSIVEKNGLRRLSVGRNNKKKLFYEALRIKKNFCDNKKEIQHIKGLLSFYLSIEKENFDDFLSDNMKKELEMYNCESIIQLIESL